MNLLGSHFRQLVADLKQLRYAKEFRIHQIDRSPDELLMLEKMHIQIAQLSQPQPPRKTEPAEPTKEHLQMLADVGTGLWRLKNKMVEPNGNRPREEMRRAYRHFESAWDALTQGGIEIQDHTGIRFDSGLSIEVIAFQPLAEMHREEVIETIRPSIYYQGKRIQMGQVIVGTPKEEK